MTTFISISLFISFHFFFHFIFSSIPNYSRQLLFCAVFPAVCVGCVSMSFLRALCCLCHIAQIQFAGVIISIQLKGRVRAGLGHSLLHTHTHTNPPHPSILHRRDTHIASSLKTRDRIVEPHNISSIFDQNLGWRMHSTKREREKEKEEKKGTLMTRPYPHEMSSRHRSTFLSPFRQFILSFLFYWITELRRFSRTITCTLGIYNTPTYMHTQ
jgi:hypothetical protein